MGDLVMKKIFSIFIIASLACAAVVSCSKELADPNDKPVQVNPGEEENPGEEGQGEGEQNIPEGMIRLTFSVSSENDTPAEPSAAADDTKTSWDKTNGHQWSEGDQIRIIWNDGASDGQTEGVDYAIATVNAGSVSANVVDADYYYAVYPADATYTLSLSEGKIEVEFGRNQSGSFSDANIMVAKTSKADASLSFKNMTSILKFSTGASCNYKKVTFAANDKTRLNGKVSTTFEEPFAVAKTSTGDNRDLLTVNVTPGQTYYLALLPDIDLDNGIGFKVEASSQLTGALSTRELTMERNKVKNLGTIDDQIHTAWFITEDGTGNGTSWEEAGGPDRLVQLIYPTQSRGAGAGLTAAWRLHKATIYVAAGTYNIQNSNGDEVLAPHYNTSTLTATIKGGYPTGLTGTSTTDQDPAVNKTYFICNQTATTDHVFEVSGDNRVNSFTFDGITFTANPEATETAISGIAFNYTSSSSVTSNVITFNNCIFEGITGSSTVGGSVIDINTTDGKPTIKFTGCTFRNNVTSGADDNYGGAIRVDSGVDIELKITNCIADNNDVTSASGRGGFLCQRRGTVTIDGGTIQNSNSAANAGAIFANHSTCILNIKDCSISNNSAASSGGVMYINSATVNIEGGTFSGNTSTGNNGGAIYQNSGTINITYGTDSTKFIGNIATGKRGGAILCKSSLNIDKAAFRENGGSDGGAIYLEAGANVLMEHSTFKRNTATNGGAIYIVSGGELTIQNGSSLISNDCTTNGGSIYNAGNLIVDGSTVTGKGKSTNLTALLGGGIYNKSGAKATLRNSSIIQGCAITGSSHHGAGIWNAGELNIDGCTIQNNKNTQRGAGIYGVGTACDITVTNTDFDDNDAANGGAIALDDGASAYINSCSFTGSDASNGAALRTCTNSGTNVNKFIVFNSLFSGNTATGNSSTQDGATIQGYGYCEILLANCTIKSNINGSTTSAVTTKKYNNADHAKLYVISCTMSDNSDGHDFLRTSNTIEIFNSILMGSSNTEHSNVKRNYSIINSTLYSTTNTKAQESITFALGTFANGVYPLDSSYASLYGAGMSSTDLQKLTFNNITLTSEQTALLAKDQKGNERNGTIMGAYVGTE